MEGVRLKLPKLPRLTQHGSEIVLLGLIAGGVIWLLGKAIDKSDGNAGAFDLAAFLLVLQAIITAIKDRWTQRGTDRALEMVGNSTPVDSASPLGGKPAGTPGDPVHVQEEPNP